MPFFIGLFCYYFLISFKEDSAAQKPEKLFKERGLMLYTVFLCILFLVIIIIKIPALEVLTDNRLIKIP